jgi:molecular chaperone GrpE
VKPDERVHHAPDPEGREALEEEAAAGSLAPSVELEEAMREAAASLEARQAGKQGAREGAPAGGAAAEALRQELAQAREEGARLAAERDQAGDRLLRLQADFDNFRKRVLRERHEALQYGHENLVKDLLGPVDNLERAIDHARRSEGADFGSLLQGLELVQRDLLGVLARHGVEVVEADGKLFDPALHEAMAQEIDDGIPPNTVLTVFQKGYKLRDRLLRPAAVVVSKQSDGGAGTAGEKAPEEGADT